MFQLRGVFGPVGDNHLKIDFMNSCTRIILGLFLFGTVLTMTGYGQVRADKEPPHIVFIYTDDQATWGVGAYGNEDAVTPNIDRLAAEGAQFEQAFVTTPVCSPARAALLTGQYGFQTGITDYIHIFREPDLGLSSAFAAWPEMLRQAGYRTGLFGKWHLGLHPDSHPTNFGYEEFVGFLGGGTTTMDPVLEIDGESRKVSGSTPDLLANAAIAFIESNRERPTLTSLHFRAPHVPYGPVPEEDDAVYRGREVQPPDYPNVDADWAQRTLRAHYKSIASIDRNVGRVLDAIDELGLKDNTLVIFTSDHGYMIGHHALYGKGTAALAASGDIRGGARRPNMFDHSIRVPLLVRWPGVVEPGSRISELVTHLDFFPTLVSAADAESYLPDGYPLSGRNMLPLLRQEDVPWRNAIFGDYDMYHYIEDSMRMIRTQDWKLIVHSNPEFGPELYNLNKDPEEKHNVMGIDNFEIMKDLREQLYAWQVWLNDPKRKSPADPL